MRAPIGMCRNASTADGIRRALQATIEGKMSVLSQVTQAFSPSMCQRKFAPVVYGGVKHWAKGLDRRLRFADRFRFADRRNHTSTLVVMLAGYKQVLWPFVMPRFRAALADTDVCIISPGLHNAELSEVCRRESWSYLSTATNDVCLAQNLGLSLHEQAEMIVKLDEDMFLLPSSISTLLDEYRHIRGEGVVNPGFVAPVIPINGFCYRFVLEQLNLLDAYEARFGPARIAGFGIPIHTDPAVARWMWERTAPLEETARQLAAQPRQVLMSPVQFSIGMIAFERVFWEDIGCFPVYRRRLMAGISTLGADEEHICAKAVARSRPAVVTTATLAGHFSFGPQYSVMKSLTETHPQLFNS